MVRDASRQGGPITFGNDPWITRVGRILRKSKIDELPRPINVLKGEILKFQHKPSLLG